MLGQLRSSGPSLYADEDRVTDELGKLTNQGDTRVRRWGAWIQVFTLECASWRKQRGLAKQHPAWVQAAHSTAGGGAPSHQPSSVACFSPSLQLCEDLFSRINDTTNDNMSYSVEVRLPACCLLLSVDLGRSRCGWGCFSDPK